jgi:hypothetical protein
MRVFTDVLCLTILTRVSGSGHSLYPDKYPDGNCPILMPFPGDLPGGVTICSNNKGYYMLADVSHETESSEECVYQFTIDEATATELERSFNKPDYDYVSALSCVLRGDWMSHEPKGLSISDNLTSSDVYEGDEKSIRCIFDNHETIIYWASEIRGLENYNNGDPTEAQKQVANAACMTLRRAKDKILHCLSSFPVLRECIME